MIWWPHWGSDDTGRYLACWVRCFWVAQRSSIRASSSDVQDTPSTNRNAPCRQERRTYWRHLLPWKKDPSSIGGAWDRDLRTDIEAIQEWGASSVLTLIEPHEFDLLSVRGLPDAVRAAGLVWLHAPIPDVSVPGPAFRAAWRTIGPRLLDDLKEGRSVVVHCRGGLGRAGMVAAMLLVMMGEDAPIAVERVRSVRPGAIETREQEAYVIGQGTLNV